MNTVQLHHGDCLDVLRTLPDASVDAVVTDPPYGLAEHKPATIVTAMTAWCSGDRDHVPDGRGFMGRAWDGFVPPPAVWDECLRILRPGGHLLAFAGSRTVDLMGISIRLAGFEVRDSITWHYGNGFPKSPDVGATIMKMHGLDPLEDEWPPEAKARRGWGTALKPASEPIIAARKPLVGTVAATVLAHGTGALNIDGCRVEHVTVNGGNLADNPHLRATINGGKGGRIIRSEDERRVITPHTAGRWPANIVLSHAPNCGDQCIDGCPVAELDAQSGTARYFPTFRYQAKAPRKERPEVDGVTHPTVKPLALMRWLVRLVCPEGGVVLDPFAGSGTTLQAARDEGFDSIGVERDETYLPLIRHRIGEGLVEDVFAHGVSAFGVSA